MTTHGSVLSVNVGHSAPLAGRAGAELSGIDKQPTSAISVRDPGGNETGAGSGVIDDDIVDRHNHGGERQAVYAVAREELDYWEGQLGRTLAPGAFGENLTTTGIDVDALLIGTMLAIGVGPDGQERHEASPAVVLEVCGPRVPCATFAAHIGERGWVKSFTARRRPGAYLAVRTPGQIVPGDSVVLTHTPDHDITIADLLAARFGDLSAAQRVLDAGVVPQSDRDYLADMLARRADGSTSAG
ncbi:MAG: MOSC domain-containing protein [Ornithinimicrobium sp.]